MIRLTGARLFDGHAFTDTPLLIDGARIAPPEAAPTREITLSGGILAPGFVDLQVNGGDGVQFNSAPTPDTLRRMARAMARLGATRFLPTLITADPATTRAAIEAVACARAEGLAGLAGLHLEGPHLAQARKGVHSADLIRPMSAEDEALYIAAAARVGHLKITLAPETVPPEQIARLVAAGIRVSLGHSDCDYDSAMAAARAGARMVTHLFNAMSPLTSRAPGLVGAALDCPELAVGVIADGVHSHPASLRAALAAKRGPAYLVSDCMAPAGSAITGFTLDGQRITRQNGRLTRADGTLAGADIDMAASLRLLTGQIGLPLSTALQMSAAAPARAMGLEPADLRPGAPADIVHLSEDLRLLAVWQGGQRVDLG